MKKFWGYTCDICNVFFTVLLFHRNGKKRRLHYCSEECFNKDLLGGKKLGP